MDAKFTRSLGISAVLLVLSASFITGTLKVAQKSSRLIEAKRELAALQQERARLEQEVQYRQSAEFVEKEARNKLNMVKPGEKVLLKPKISGDDLLGAQATQADGLEAKPGFFAPVTARINSWFDKIRDLLLLFQS